MGNSNSKRLIKKPPSGGFLDNRESKRGSAAYTDNFKFFFDGIQIRACGARTK